MANILILGAGSIGTAFSFPCSDKNNSVTIVGTYLENNFIDQINSNLKAIINRENFGIDFTKCIDNKKIEDYILEDRIESERKFEINSTPTLIINNKKFDKPLTYKNLKKAIEKLI